MEDEEKIMKIEIIENKNLDEFKHLINEFIIEKEIIDIKYAIYTPNYIYSAMIIYLGEQDEPVDPDEPTEPDDPNEPTEPDDPNEPTEPV